MKCPDIDELIEVYHGAQMSREMKRHLRTCHACRADLEVMDLLPSVWEAREEVPESWVQGLMGRWSEAEAQRGAEKHGVPADPEPSESHGRLAVPVGQGLLSGTYGFLTSLAAVIVSGTVGMGDPVVLIGLSLAAAGLAWIGLPRWVAHLEQAEA